MWDTSLHSDCATTCLPEPYPALTVTDAKPTSDREVPCALKNHIRDGVHGEVLGSLSEQSYRLSFLQWTINYRSSDLDIEEEEELLRCPLIWCRKIFESKASAAHHVVSCPRLSSAWYWCPHHRRLERFLECSQLCEAVPQSMARYGDYKLHFADEYLNWIGRGRGSGCDEKTTQDRNTRLEYTGRQSNDRSGALMQPPRVEKVLSSSRENFLNFDRPLLALPQRKSPDLKSPLLSNPYLDSAQTSPTSTSSFRRCSSTNRGPILASRTSVPYSDFKGWKDSSANTPRSIDWSVYDTIGEPDSHREPSLKFSGKMETAMDDMLANNASSKDQSRLEGPNPPYSCWDTVSPGTFAPTTDSSASNFVSPTSQCFRLPFSVSPTISSPEQFSTLSTHVSPVSTSQDFLTPAMLACDWDASDCMFLGSKPLESGRQKHKHIDSACHTYGSDLLLQYPAIPQVAFALPGAQSAIERVPTQTYLPRNESFDMADSSIIDEFLAPETSPFMRSPSMTHLDTSTTWNPAHPPSVPFPTPLVHETYEHSNFMYDSVENVKAGLPVPNLSPAGLNDGNQGLYQLPSPVKEAQMGECECPGAETPSPLKKLPHCFRHRSLLVTHSPSKRTQTEELQALIGVVYHEWMQKWKSVPELNLRCSVLPLDALFQNSICTLKECFRGRMPQKFEDLFSLLHLAIAAAFFLRCQQGFYCWDTFYRDALQWKHALSTHEDQALLLKAMGPELRPSPLLSSDRRASLGGGLPNGSIEAGDHILPSDALRESELLKAPIGFLESFEESGIGERNTSFPAAELASRAEDRQRKIQHMIRTITQPLQRERGLEALQRTVIDAELHLDQELLRDPREVEVTLVTSGRWNSESPEVFNRFRDSVVSRCEEAMRTSDWDWHPNYRTDYLVGDLETLLEISQGLPNQPLSESDSKQRPGTSALAVRRRQRPTLKSPISSSAPSEGITTLQSTPSTFTSWTSMDTPCTADFSSQTTSPATMSQDSLPPSSPAPESPVSCRACSLTFTGSPQDARSNYTRHMRTAKRHTNKETGLKCPHPDCREKSRMRSDNLKPHLLNVHKISSDAKRQEILDECRNSAGRVDRNGVAGRRSHRRLDTDLAGALSSPND